MGRYLVIMLFLAPFFAAGQNKESETRKFIGEGKFTRINKDWNTIAEFSSGIGEYVNFFPINVTNLKTSETQNALELNMYVKKPEVYKTAWVGLDEIDEFIFFY